jgi:hypothetical protein
MFSGYLVPTEYGQPKPTDGEYAATVYSTYAEFEFRGNKVIAQASANTLMNANGNIGVVKINGDELAISWTGSANNSNHPNISNEVRTRSLEKALIATLKPTEFEQPHPFLNGSAEYRGEIKSIHVEFGVLDKYTAFIDGNVCSCASGAPCIIRPIKDNPKKCEVEFSDATIFMATRYGCGTYENLVSQAVTELQKIIS